MIKNYFKIAWRNLWKNKLFSFINIMGLGLAIPFALMSLMQAIEMYEFDNFHPNADRIYRIRTDVTDNNGNKTKYASSPNLLSAQLKDNYPCVEKSTKVLRDYGWELNNRMKAIRVNTIYVEPSFFEIFGFSFEKGSLPVLPNTLALTHEMASIFFGDANPVGKTLSHPKLGEFVVTGVLKPFKRGTQFRSDAMVSMATYTSFNKPETGPESWTKYDAQSFVLLQSNAGVKSLNAAVADISKITNAGLAPYKQSNLFIAQPLNNISPDFEDLQNNPYVESLLDMMINFGLGLMIIILAGFNYTNLTLARSLSRAKEVGVRKTSGAQRWQLVVQFVCEAIVISLFALLIGFAILTLMKEFVHVQWITWTVDNQLLLWIVFFVFTLFIGLLAGILPAWILSGFQPIKVLKGDANPGTFGKINFRKSLVVIQFVATACYVFLIAHMYNEFNYMATDNENFNRKNIVNISLTDSRYRLLAQDIAGNKNVETVGLVSTPFGGITSECAIRPAGSTEYSAAYYYAADAGFVENMKLKFVAGNNLPVSNADSAGNFVLINERALSVLGFASPQEAVGKSILLDNKSDIIIAGVLKDFCYSNYQFALQPVVLQYNPSQFHVLSVKTTDNTAEAAFTASMKSVWKKYYPHEDLSISYYQKELYERYYPGADMKFMGMTSGIIFVIAMMGLLGMVTYTTEKRLKEIGIRKVMGGSVIKIMRTLSWSFIKLLLIAGIIALPIGYFSGVFVTNMFAFNDGINLGLMFFLFCFIFLIALATIGIQVLKAAMLNPVKSLRSE